jgi:hypothetical protein
MKTGEICCNEGLNTLTMVTTRSKKPITSKAGTPAKPAAQQEGKEDADEDADSNDYECSDEEDLKPPPPEAVKKKKAKAKAGKSVQSGGSVSSGTQQWLPVNLPW